MNTKPQTWRLTTWTTVAFNVVMLWYLLNGLQTAGATCSNTTAANCETVAAMAAVMAVGMAVFFLVAGNLILGVISVTTKGRKRRTCPRCWAHISPKMPFCPSCKFDFMAARRPRSYQTI